MQPPARVVATHCSQCPPWCRMIYAFLTTMLVAAAALVPGTEAGSRNHVITASAHASQNSTNGSKTRGASLSPSPPVTSVKHETLISKEGCCAFDTYFEIADSKSAHVTAGVPRLDI
jgi:hypothetical protein